MSSDDNQSTWFSERNVSFLVAVLSVTLLVLIVLPYLKYVLLAVVLAYVLMPAQRLLERRMNSMRAAITLVVSAVLLIIIPAVYVLAVAIQEGMELAAAVEEGDLTVTAIETRLGTAGYPMNLDGLYSTYQDPIKTGLQGVVTSAFEVVGGVLELFIGLTVTIFVLYSLLYDGDRLLTWFREIIPINDRIQNKLLEELDQLMWASVVSNVAIAFIQAILLGIAVALAGIPGVVLITVATFIFALLPLVGVVIVWFPLSLYLMILGRPIAAVLLFVYGVILSSVDNYLRAAVMGHSAEINVAIVVVGIFGGVALFGVVGLFIGPVILGGAKITLETVLREQTRKTRPSM